jgi:hypothetical protein
MDYPLSSSDIENMLDRQCTVIEYSQLRDVDNIGTLVSEAMPLIILYEWKPSYGHWTILLKRPNYFEFFDSLGAPVDGELKYVPKNYRRHLGEDVPHLTHLLRDQEVVNNPCKLQADKATTCGRWVVLRAQWAELNLPEFLRVVVNLPGDLDQAVVQLTEPARLASS